MNFGLVTFKVKHKCNNSTEVGHGEDHNHRLKCSNKLVVAVNLKAKCNIKEVLGVAKLKPKCSNKQVVGRGHKLKKPRLPSYLKKTDEA